MRVLLVDSSDHDAERTTAAVQQRMGEAVSVHRVATMSQALRALTTDIFDVVVLVLCVRDASGIATLGGVRGAAAHTPVVVYTQSLDEALAIRALRAGAQECLAKSEASPEMLTRALHSAIERHRNLTLLHDEREAAAHRATHDPLTGLANRALFLDHLEQALSLGARYARKTAILFVDLDSFKQVNDAHGHARGDLVLRAVANRLVECVRRSDAVGRLGGDEFVVLLSDVTSRRDVAHVRDTILECVREPIDVGGGLTLTLGASVGGAMAPLDGESAQALLDAADTDMYRQKFQRRRERVSTPAPGAKAVLSAVAELSARGMSETLMHRREARMRQAVQAGEFEVHYQPIIDVATNSICCAEALLRWRDPDRGLLLPQSFLALAEDTGLIVPIGEMVLRDACRSVVSWRRLTGRALTRISVNVSAVQLRERGFVGRVAGILDETGCPPDALTLELTETSALVDGEVAIEALRELKAMGTRLVVDDFGVGLASLTFVREAPIDGIKLERRFVMGMLRDRRDLAIIASMIRLAQGLRLEVTAEGVESSEHVARLAGLQCFRQQGRHFSGAVTAVEAEALMRRAPGAFSAVLQDLGRTGAALARALRTREARRKRIENKG